MLTSILTLDVIGGVVGGVLSSVNEATTKVKEQNSLKTYQSKVDTFTSKLESSVKNPFFDEEIQKELKDLVKDGETLVAKGEVEGTSILETLNKIIEKLDELLKKFTDLAERFAELESRVNEFNHPRL